MRKVIAKTVQRPRCNSLPPIWPTGERQLFRRAACHGAFVENCEVGWLGPMFGNPSYWSCSPFSMPPRQTASQHGAAGTLFGLLPHLLD
jgi:hypothetical protein